MRVPKLKHVWFHGRLQGRVLLLYSGLFYGAQRSSRAMHAADGSQICSLCAWQSTGDQAVSQASRLRGSGCSTLTQPLGSAKTAAQWGTTFAAPPALFETFESWM